MCLCLSLCLIDSLTSHPNFTSRGTATKHRTFEQHDRVHEGKARSCNGVGSQTEGITALKFYQLHTHKFMYDWSNMPQHIWVSAGVDRVHILPQRPTTLPCCRDCGCVCVLTQHLFFVSCGVSVLLRCLILRLFIACH